MASPDQRREPGLRGIQHGQLDKSMRARLGRTFKKPVFIAAAFALLLLVGLILILGLVHAYAIKEPGQCFGGAFSHAQWPRWIWCAMSAHEGLAGGLIGAAGALIAAVIAAAVVWQQLQFERYKFRVGERRREQIELYGLERVVDYYKRLLQVFDQAQGHENIKFVNGLDAIYKSGRLVAFFGVLPAEHQGLVRDVWERLSNLNYALTESRKNGASGVGDLRAREAINTGISEVVSDMRKHLALAESAVVERKATD